MSSDRVYSTQLCILPQNFPIFFFYHILHRTVSVGLFVFFFWMYVYEICHNTEIFKLAPFLDLFVVCFLKFKLSFLTYTDTHVHRCTRTHTLWTIHQNHANINANRILVWRFERCVWVHREVIWWRGTRWDVGRRPQHMALCCLFSVDWWHHEIS